MGMLVGGFLRLWRDGIHGNPPEVAMAKRVSAIIAERDSVRRL
jgi:hypothetical protein